MSPLNYKKLVSIFHAITLLAVFYTTLEITAYYTGNVTCNGTTPIPWYTAAADDLPRGTKVTVLGNTWVVDDCFGGNYRNKLDLFMPDYQSCMNWGRRKILCRIETPN